MLSNEKSKTLTKAASRTSNVRQEAFSQLGQLMTLTALVHRPLRADFHETNCSANSPRTRGENCAAAKFFAKTIYSANVFFHLHVEANFGASFA